MNAKTAYDLMVSKIFKENKYPKFNAEEKQLYSMYKIKDLYVFVFQNKDQIGTDSTVDLDFVVNSKTGDSYFEDGIVIAMEYGMVENNAFIDFSEFK